ncbi:sterol desaturase family protein [Pseudomonas gingeri]|uniref:Sterol desaturase family protein n=1 Tax=Pseudomonas gingeri TaxID=117681 RepID=A0A7Y7XGC9_9PSED|nr:sterol desaturase family protein [Pseudomonas gingeri]NWB98293.1 sterol desaturase family protein [Pseudomonas gingeri]
MKSVLSWLYAPVFWCGFLGASLGLFEQLWSLPLLFLLAVTVSFLAEWGLPYEPLWNHSKADRFRDIAHGLVNESLNALGLLVLPILALWLPFAVVWPQTWPLWLQLLLAVVIADAGITLAHYASHRLPWLWRLHAVHHSVQRMYGFNGLMKHPLHQALEATAGLLPLWLLGIPQGVAALLAFAIAIQLLLQHSNVDMRLGPLRWIFAWAPLHRFHHMKYGKAGDVNFGLFFTLWDRLLGTAFYTQGYRIGEGDLGIGTRADFPVGYVRQLIDPFISAPTHPAPVTPEPLQRRVNPAVVPGSGPGREQR